MEICFLCFPKKIRYAQIKKHENAFRTPRKSNIELSLMFLLVFVVSKGFMKAPGNANLANANLAFPSTKNQCASVWHPSTRAVIRNLQLLQEIGPVFFRKSSAVLCDLQDLAFSLVFSRVEDIDILSARVLHHV